MNIAEKTLLLKQDFDEVYKAGKKSEYDKFWDAFQYNGTRNRYDLAFYRFGSGGFYPKYDIAPTGGTLTQFMNYFGADSDTPIDVADRFAQGGVKLDTSKVTSLKMAFYWTDGISRLPKIDATGVTASDGLYATFGSNSNLETIDEFALPDDGNHPELSLTFASLGKLKNIVISGAIGKNVDFGYSLKLTRASILSIINALSDTTTGLTVTLSKAAVNKAFEDGEGAGNGSNSQEWTIDVVPSKPNWKIALI